MENDRRTPGSTLMTSKGHSGSTGSTPTGSLTGMNEQSSNRKLFRSRSDRYVGGVAAGIGARFNVDPVFVRIAFVASLVFGGLGLLAYVVMLAVVPIEGDPSEPLAPLEPRRRNMMIGLAVLVCVIALIASDAGSVAPWLLGFWPGTVFGILFWSAVAIAVLWLFLTGRFNRGNGAQPASPAPAASGPEASTEVVTYAQSPTQLSTEVMETRQMESEQSGSSGPEPSAPTPAGEPAKRNGPSTIGRVMLWLAIGISALTVFCILFVVSAGTTALVGGVPMAALVILLGGGMVFAGVRGRRSISLWLLVAAVAVAVPMAAVSIADLRVEGSYGDINETPVSTVDIPSEGYKMAAGNMTIDLRKFPFSGDRELDLPVSSGMGLTSVIVPDRICVAGSVSGKAGVTNIRGRQTEGIDTRQSASGPIGWKPGMGISGDVLYLDADFKLGAFEVVDNTQWRQSGRAGSFNENDLEPSDEASVAARERASAACSAIGSERGDKPGTTKEDDAKARS